MHPVAPWTLDPPAFELQIQAPARDREVSDPQDFLVGIVRLSEFDQKLGNTRIHNSLIVQHSGSWPEVENQANLT